MKTYDLILRSLRLANLIFACLLFLGCAGSFQSGRYVVTSESVKTTETGIEIELLGHAATSRDPEAILLRISVRVDLPPPYQTSHYGYHKGNVSKVKHRFANQDVALDLNIEWDRRTLSCVVNGKSIPFKIGEVISVELCPDGSIRW